jgi:LuxR family maltose regulon positive regulatory protein
MSGDHLVWVIPAVGRFAQQQRDLRVLRYLTAPEIAGELSVSPNTVRTHVKSLYAKLGTHRRAGAVERARVLGLLAPRVRGTQ